MNNGKIPTILTDEDFQQEVIENPEPVIVEIGAEWCGTCHIIAPIIEKLAVKFNEQIKFARLDIDRSKRMAGEYHITDLPTLLFFNNGQIVDHLFGAVSGYEVEAKIKTLLQFQRGEAAY